MGTLRYMMTSFSENYFFWLLRGFPLKRVTHSAAWCKQTGLQTHVGYFALK